MDPVSACADTLDDALASLLRPLIDQELSIVFYDLTTIRSEGGTDLPEDVRPCLPKVTSVLLHPWQTKFRGKLTHRHVSSVHRSILVRSS